MTCREEARTLPACETDVVIAGGGTAGVVAALAAARTGARTHLIEAKGYPGGTVVEGGTALHSFFNLWKAFPDVPKRQVVAGIAQEIVDRLSLRGGTTGHAEMAFGYDYDSVCTAIDTELYKVTVFEMLDEAGVSLQMNTLVADAVRDETSVKAVITESRSGREALFADAFVDCTGYGDLCARAGASCREPNDYPVANSIGVAGVNVERYFDFLQSRGAVRELALGRRGGRDLQIVRLSGVPARLPEGFREEAARIGMATVTTTVHDDYFMFIKLNLKLQVSPTDARAVAAAELELRRRQLRAVELFRAYVPGCEKAFIARTSPSLCIRRGRLIDCDLDLSLEDVLEGRRFDDEVMIYGFHDSAPRLQIRDGGKKAERWHVETY